MPGCRNILYLLLEVSIAAYFGPIASWDTWRTWWSIISVNALKVGMQKQVICEYLQLDCLKVQLSNSPVTQMKIKIQRQIK